MQDERFPKSPETIRLQLASLKACSITELKEQWRALYSSEPPHRISRELLTRAVAYRIQEQVHGGLKPSTRRLLLRLANDARSGRPLRPEPAPAAPAGTVLMREWHGVTHEVRVFDRGVLLQTKALSVAHRGRPADHRRALEWATVLRFARQAKAGDKS